MGVGLHNRRGLCAGGKKYKNNSHIQSLRLFAYIRDMIFLMMKNMKI